MNLSRRALLAGAASLPLSACRREARYDGGWLGAAHQRGHTLRDMQAGPLPPPAVQRRAGVIIVGAGVAGLACARALARAGIDDVQVFDLEDTAGGNSRGHQIAGMACPLGAHYLPLPDDRDEALIGLLEEFGLCRTEQGRRVYDERHLCHSPQERLFIHGQWQDGLLPVLGQTEETLAEYRRFSAATASAGQRLGFTLPTAHTPWTAAHQALDGVTFTAWLDAQGLRSAALRTYLDYCCRDDYGAGAAQVSAWAGVQYFASRHGFRAPGSSADDGAHDDREAVLTWPQGNAWLTARLAAPLHDRLHTGLLAWRVNQGRSEVSVDLWDTRLQRIERWTAAQVVLALPLFVAARLIGNPPSALPAAASHMRYAPWLAANLHLDQALDDRPGAAPSWDNVIHGSPSLGYVDAMHQSTLPYAAATVLTSYWALGGSSAAQLQANRARLLQDDWRVWAGSVVQDLALPHPDLPAKVRRVDLMRYGHAMSIPVPGVRGSAALQSLAALGGRLQFAHSDLSGYSVFEEAFFQGNRAAASVKTFSARR
ncbi:MAG TPA: FAD-dependent oxidoreductase [Rhizobacter sp.]|nr:FAD-dependent oxidoreductase [Rhizobacter sp.]